MMPSFGPGSFFADRYRIDSLLGSGAMGRVYAAVELHSSRRVALKILHKERLGEPETVARFKREAEVLASIGHPCIVEIYTFHHTSDGTPYLAMELLEGVTLKTRLTNAGRFEDPKNFQEVLDCISGALGAAHARGVVHRDMKPDNVFLPATGAPRAKLVDFGLSRMQSQPKTLTASGMILGTPRYMAPEQLRNASAAGPAVDIYSLGVVLYESLTGQSPYPAQDYGQLLGCVMENRVTPLERIRPELSAVGDVVRRAMAADPAQRFATCDELSAAYASAIGSPSRHMAVATPGPGPRVRRVSNPALLANKGSTLAFDASALDRLPDLHEAAPLFGGSSMADSPAPRAHAPSFGGHSMADSPAPRAHAPSFGGHSMADTPAPRHEPPRSAPPPPMELPAKGGDTLFIPSLHEQPPGGVSGTGPTMSPDGTPRSQPPPSMHSQPPPSLRSQPPPSILSMSHAGTPQPRGVAPQATAARSFAAPQAAQPKKKKGRGVVLFLVAMVLVIVLSAAGGLALRAYMRGELQLPGVSRST